MIDNITLRPCRGIRAAWAATVTGRDDILITTAIGLGTLVERVRTNHPTASIHIPSQQDADLAEASGAATCKACGRPELDCSREPCEAVKADREDGGEAPFAWEERVSVRGRQGTVDHATESHHGPDYPDDVFVVFDDAPELAERHPATDVVRIEED